MRRADRSPLFARHRSGDPVPAAEQRHAVTMEIAPPAPPETTAKTEVIVQAEPPAPKLAVIANEDALNLFGGRRNLSFSAPVRQAYLDANPGPEPTFRSVVADHAEWAYLLNLSLPAPPRAGATETATEDPGSAAVQRDGAPAIRPAAADPVTDPGLGESGKDADPVPADAPAAPGPVSTGRPAAKKRAKAAGA